MGLAGNFDGVEDTQILADINAYGLSQLADEDCETMIPVDPFVCADSSMW